MRRLVQTITLLLALVGLVALAPAPALAASTDPVVYDDLNFTFELDDLKIEPREVEPGDTIHFSMTCENEDVRGIWLTIANPASGSTSTVEMYDDDEDGTFEGEFATYDGTPGGTWKVITMYVYMTAPGSAAPDVVIADAGTGDNEDSGFTFFRDLSELSFTLASDEGDTTPPVVAYTTIEASPKTATVGDTVTVTIQAYDDFGMSTNPGAGVTVSYRNGSQVRLSQVEPGIFSGTITIVPGMSNGVWETSSIAATDDAGNRITMWDQRGYDDKKDFSGGDFTLVDVPASEQVGTFDIDLEHATRTPADELIQPGTRVWVSVPMSATAGIKSARLNFYASHT